MASGDSSSSSSSSPPRSSAPECDDVQQSLALLDRVLLEFDDPASLGSVVPPAAPAAASEPPPPPEEAARLISALIPRGSPRGSPGQSLPRRSPPDPGGGLPSPSQASAATQTTLPKVSRHLGSKKLSSRFGSLPFDLSSHAAPAQPPAWLAGLESRLQQREVEGRVQQREVEGRVQQRETCSNGVSGPSSSSGSASGGDRNLLHLPLHNPLTSTLAHNTGSDESCEDEEQFSDDSLEGQVSSSDREADLRDLGSTTSKEGGAEDEPDEPRQRSSVAWEIDWDLDLAAAAKKRRTEGVVKSRSQPQTPCCPAPIPTSKSGGGGTYVIRDRKKRPALPEATFFFCPVLPSSATFTSGQQQQQQQQRRRSKQQGPRMVKGKSMPSLKQPSALKHVPEPPLSRPEDKPSGASPLSAHAEQSTTLPQKSTTVSQKNPHSEHQATPAAENPTENGVPSEPPTAEVLMENVENGIPSEPLGEPMENGIPSPLSPSSSSTEAKCNNPESKLHNGSLESSLMSDDISCSQTSTECNTDVVSQNCTEHVKIIDPMRINTEILEVLNEDKKSLEQIDVVKPDLVKVENARNDVVVESRNTEMSFKIMRPKKIRPNSMPLSEENVVVFKTTVHLDPSNSKRGQEEGHNSCSAKIPEIPSAGVTVVGTEEGGEERVQELSSVRPKSVCVTCSTETEEGGEGRVQGLAVRPKSVTCITEALSCSASTAETSETAAPISVEEQCAPQELLPPPPSPAELGEQEEEEEEEEEMRDQVEVLTVSSLVQTDISALQGRRHRLVCDSPSEEQVVPSLAFRPLLTPDEPPLPDKSLSLLPPLHEGAVSCRNVTLIQCLESDAAARRDMGTTTDVATGRDENEAIITTVIIESKEDKELELNFSPIKRPTDLFPIQPLSLEPGKLSRDSQRRKSHGSSMEVASRATENRRSAPECNFLFPQGHYTIPLSFAVTNKPPGRPQPVSEPAPREPQASQAPEPQHVTVEASAPPQPEEPQYKSVRKNKQPNGVAKRGREERAPPPPPHRTLSPQEDEYAEPRHVPDFSSARSRIPQTGPRPPRPKNLHKEASQPPPPPPHQEMFEAEKPLPPTPLTPVQNLKLSITEDFDTHPLPPSPPSPKPLRPLPMSATFPVPPSPSSMHRLKNQHGASPRARRHTPPSPSLPRPPSPLVRSRPYPLPASPGHARENGADLRPLPRRPLPSPPESDYGFVIRESPGGLGSLKTRSVDAGLGRGLRDQLASSISQAKNEQGGADRRTLPMELSGATPRRQGQPQFSTGMRQQGARKNKGRAPAVPPHASLPETPVFTRGCDIPRAPYKPPAVGIPVLRSSLSEEGDRLVLCGPARGWYPKQRQNKSARSTEHLDQAGCSSLWGEARKPQTLPPNLQPPKFFHRSPREALRRVTSLLIRNRTGTSSKEPRPTKEVVSPNGASGSQCETPQRQKRSFFRNFWKKSKHYSLEQ